MTVKACVISNGQPVVRFQCASTESLETLLSTFGFVRQGEWLPDKDFGHAKSTTFINQASGVSAIVCKD